MGRAQPISVCFQHQHGAEPFLEVSGGTCACCFGTIKLSRTRAVPWALCSELSDQGTHNTSCRGAFLLTSFSAICNRFHLSMIWLPAGFLLSSASPAQLNPMFSPPLLPVHHLGIAVLLLLLIYGEISLYSHPWCKAKAHKVPCGEQVPRQASPTERLIHREFPPDT